MTTEENDTVRQLWEQGNGYKTISNITGLHRETMRSYINRHVSHEVSTGSVYDDPDHGLVCF